MIGVLIVRQGSILGVEGPFVNDFSLIVGRYWAETPIFWHPEESAGGFLPVFVAQPRGRMEICSGCAHRPRSV